MPNRYVDVVITRQTQAVAQAGFGMPLILGTSKAQPYTEYTTAAAVAADFGAESKEAKIAEKMFSGNPKIDKVAAFGIVYNGATGDGSALITALNTLVLSNNDWFYLYTPEQTADEITALSAWADANGKLYFVDTADQTLANTGLNTIVVVSPTAATEFPAAAWIGYGAPLEVGSFTWTFKTLPGVTPVTYNEGQVTAIHDKSMNTYIRQSGVNITSNGKTAGGEYIDIIQSQHYLTARITEAVFQVLASRKKVPMTDAGISLIVAAVEKVLQQAGNAGMIAEAEGGQYDYNVTAPARADIPDNDRANRRLPDIRFAAVMAGAIEDVGINGVISV